MDKGFCEKCNNLVEYEIKEINDNIEIKGKKYNYKRLMGYCKKCGEEISSNEIYEKYKEFKSANIIIDIEDIIVDEKRVILNAVVKYFGYYNGKALEKMSHYETPWINARKGLLLSENSNNIINKEDIKEYFEKVINKYDMLNILNIKKYSDDQFRRIIEM